VGRENRKEAVIMSSLWLMEEEQPQKAIVLSDSVYHSYLGTYFLGQTEWISFGGRFKAWGGLFNPPDSKVNMFLNAYTISNFSEMPITAEGWLGSRFSGNAETSEHYAAGNQSFHPPRQPKVRIQSASFVTGSPDGGTYTFVRRVEPAMTLTKHDFQGMYIIPPGSSFALFYLPPGDILVHVKVAFGWWEEER
jgi:hypothetical protein